jgi:hypothetical protein
VIHAEVDGPFTAVASIRDAKLAERVADDPRGMMRYDGDASEKRKDRRRAMWKIGYPQEGRKVLYIFEAKIQKEGEL